MAMVEVKIEQCCPWPRPSVIESAVAIQGAINHQMNMRSDVFTYPPAKSLNLRERIFVFFWAWWNRHA